MPSLIRAYELRDRLTERERYAVEANYFLVVVGDVQSPSLRSASTLTRWRTSAWRAGMVLDSGNVLAMTGDLAGAERVLQEAACVIPTAANQAGLVTVLYAEGKDGEIPAVLAELARRHPDHPTVDDRYALGCSRTPAGTTPRMPSRHSRARSRRIG